MAGPTDVAGPLARMWREVYAKAAAVAEARTAELLKYHVYVYRHGGEPGPPGPAGGGWVLLYEHEVTAPAGELALRLPDTGSLPQTHGTLVVELRCRSTATGTARDSVTLAVNGEALYNYAYTLTRNDVGTVDGFASSFDSNWPVGACPRSGAPAGTMGTTVVRLPMYALTDAKKSMLAESVTSQGNADTNPYLQQAGGWVETSTAAVEALVLRVGVGEFAPGSRVRVWGVTGA